MAHPTDTCYGLAVDIHNPAALLHLYHTKGMDLSKPVSILTASLKEAQKYAQFSDLALRLVKQFWPGALTLVLPRKSVLPFFLNSDESFVGLRCIDEPFSVALLQAWGGPVTTTSANFHGKSSPYAVRDISVQPDFILDAGDIPVRMPSTIIRIDDENVNLLRSGDLDEAVFEFLSREGVEMES